MNDDNRLIVAQPRGQNVILAVIFVIIVIVVLIIVVLRLRKITAATNTSTGSGSSQCVNDVDCNGTQVCSTARGVCVDCISDVNCPANLPVCDSSNNQCVGCLSNAGCPINKPHCDSASKQCVQCTGSSDCGGGTPLCNTITKTCVGCISPGDCPMGAPICAPGNNTCVQCLTNSQCTAPATCNSGFCCNTIAPTLTSLAANITPPGNPHISGTYTFAQPAGTTTAVFQILDQTGFLLLETPGTPANGNISIFMNSLNTFPKFFSTYTYQVRVRMSQPCGATNFSNTMSVTIPYPPTPYIPVIDSVGGDTSTFTVVTTTPDASSLCIFYDPTVWVIPFADGPSVDLNRVAHQDSTFCTVTGTKEQFVGFWPFPVASGQKFYIILTGQQGYDWVVPSAPAVFTVP